jgi:MYXO-CTERM domain-containing protein
VGGNRYGWFAYNEFSVLAFDNTELRTADVSAVPEPASLAVWGVGALGLAIAARRRRQKLAA